MKILHTGDLHIGKYVHDFSMLEDQKYILEQILEIAVREKVQAMLIAGDVYDRSVPVAEGVTLLDDFLTKVLAEGIEIILISGNHDSPERLGFAGRILEKQGLHIAGNIREAGVKKVTLEDMYGPVHFFCLPYCRPGTVGAPGCQAAAELLLSGAEPDERERNILLAHYFVTDHGREPLLSDSETTVHIGGLDNVDVSLFRAFDYVALGHIHRPQQIGGCAAYYAGSPLKYSFSEACYDKSVNLVTVGEKGDIYVRKEQLRPLHEMRVIKGSLEQILQAAGENRVEDYVQVTLTDEAELYEPMAALRNVYPNIMKLLQSGGEPEETEEISRVDRGRDALQMYRDFYREVRGKEMDDMRLDIVREVMKEAEAE